MANDVERRGCGWKGRTRRACALALACLIAMSPGCGGSDDFATHFATDRQTFDRHEWATGGERWSMCADLRSNHLRVGMSRQEVLALLGEPTKSDAKSLHYDVCQYWLDVLFDEQDLLRDTILEMY